MYKNLFVTFIMLRKQQSRAGLSRKIKFLNNYETVIVKKKDICLKKDNDKEDFLPLSMTMVKYYPANC